MRSCIWITSAVGSSDSAVSRATEVPVAALSLSSAPTTAYPVIFFSILTAMTRFLVAVLVCGAWRGEGEAGPHPNPSPAGGRGASSWLLLLRGLAGGLPGSCLLRRGLLRSLARCGLLR